MKKIDAYIFKKYIGTFFFAISMLILVVIIFDLSENIDSFLRHHAPWQRVVVDYYIMSIPYYINLASVFGASFILICSPPSPSR